MVEPTTLNQLGQRRAKMGCRFGNDVEISRVGPDDPCPSSAAGAALDLCELMGGH
ncbi:MAG TPA: hypothetical protein VER33_24160 [Polyangiaceae bacterium]|nr:hypothetical protein [Polyangiaceae bacterium]